MDYRIVIDPELGRKVGGVVAFGDFELTADAESGVVYSAGDLQAFYRDILMGRQFPTVMATRGIHTVAQLVTVALFLHRELVLHPKMLALVAAVELVDEQGVAGLAHIDGDLGRFFKLLTGMLPSQLGRKQQHAQLETAVGWIREYLTEDRLPALPHGPPAPTVLQSHQGFVVAEAKSSRALDEGWVELFRQGFLWGILWGPAREGRRRALGGRKSPFIPVALDQVAHHLNQAESAMGEPSEWVAQVNWLRGPKAGTLLPIEEVAKVLALQFSGARS